MEYSHKVEFYKRNAIESDGINTFIDELIGIYQGKVKFHSGIIRKHSQNGNISEIAQDLTIIIPRKIAMGNLREVKNTGFIKISGISYLVNHFIVSDFLNIVEIVCREGEI